MNQCIPCAIIEATLQVKQSVAQQTMTQQSMTQQTMTQQTNDAARE